MSDFSEGCGLGGRTVTMFGFCDFCQIPRRRKHIIDIYIDYRYRYMIYAGSTQFMGDSAKSMCHIDLGSLFDPASTISVRFGDIQCHEFHRLS